MEAAREIAAQLRLRNLSGIILVDFIDMESEQDQKSLLELLRQEVRKDRCGYDKVGIGGNYTQKGSQKSL